mmetsp:Transcript_86152/g.136000  ORF Transcript_86152/g.136000 Transcript_86152/m.136000 type:complete len:86 (-) Transcript_86152:95-352(-)
MSPQRFLAQLLGPKLQQATKDLLLSSPLFHKFARESSRRAQPILDEAMKAATDTIHGASKRGEAALRNLEKIADSNTNARSSGKK